jgi:phosphonate transport system substrate-binding protein
MLSPPRIKTIRAANEIVKLRWLDFRSDEHTKGESRMISRMVSIASPINNIPGSPRRARFHHSRNIGATVAAIWFAAMLGPAAAQECKNRGDLDAIYCDQNKDLLADPPADPTKRKNPSSLLMSYTPQEDAQAYEKLWQPFVDHMSQCSGKKARFFQVHSPAATVEAIRSGRITLSTLSSGDTPFAVNIAGAVPYAIRGDAKGPTGYHLVVIVKQSSPFKSLKDLIGKRVAHAAPSSNSGNLAPRALFPAEGLVPDKDYKVLYSGKHDSSIAGVQSGDYDAAAIADDVLDRMIQRGIVKPDELRVIYRSQPFPNGSMVMTHDLTADLQQKITDCTMSFKFTPELIKAFQGADRFWPLNYQKDFALVRKVAEASGESFNRAAYDKRVAREADAAKTAGAKK